MESSRVESSRVSQVKSSQVYGQRSSSAVAALRVAFGAPRLCDPFIPLHLQRYMQQHNHAHAAVRRAHDSSGERRVERVPEVCRRPLCEAAVPLHTGHRTSSAVSIMRSDTSTKSSQVKKSSQVNTSLQRGVHHKIGHEQRGLRSARGGRQRVARLQDAVRAAHLHSRAHTQCTRHSAHATVRLDSEESARISYHSSSAWGAELGGECVGALSASV
jgi:hypothetical protein